MSFDYLETAQDALDALAEFGALASITSALPGASDDYDPATGGPVSAPAVVTTTAFGAIFDYPPHAYGNQPDARILAGDRQLYLAAIDVNGAPVLEAALRVDAAVFAPDGGRYLVKNVKPLAPAGVAVLYDINVRRPG